MCKKNHAMMIVALSIMIGWSFLSVAQAQNWQALPPYNILWPLWSPTQSPVDPLTGLPTPLITELSANTILPVQPVLGWNPNSYSWPMSITMPWLFYNGPTGVLFFDVLYGLNPWPPSSYIDPISNAAIPITLPPDYTFSPLPLLKETQYLVELGNLNYLLAYGSALGIAPSSLWTYADIWGLPAI
jgi:hypothetical protein